MQFIFCIFSELFSPEETGSFHKFSSQDIVSYVQLAVDIPRNQLIVGAR